MLSQLRYFLSTPYDQSRLVSLLKPEMRPHLWHPTRPLSQPQLLQYQLETQQMQQMPLQLMLQSKRLDVAGGNQLDLNRVQYHRKLQSFEQPLLALP